MQLTSLKGDDCGNQVPIDRSLRRSLFPRLDWVVDRISGDGRGDGFELIRTRDWSRGRVVLVGDAASGQPPFWGKAAAAR